MAIFIVIWPYLLTTKLRCLLKNNNGHSTPGLPEILDAMVDCPILHSNTSRKITESTLKKVIHTKASTDLAGKGPYYYMLAICSDFLTNLIPRCAK